MTKSESSCSHCGGRGSVGVGSMPDGSPIEAACPVCSVDDAPLENLAAFVESVFAEIAQDGPGVLFVVKTSGEGSVGPSAGAQEATDALAEVSRSERLRVVALLNGVAEECCDSDAQRDVVAARLVSELDGALRRGRDGFEAWSANRVVTYLMRADYYERDWIEVRAQTEGMIRAFEEIERIVWGTIGTLSAGQRSLLNDWVELRS